MSTRPTPYPHRVDPVAPAKFRDTADSHSVPDVLDEASDPFAQQSSLHAEKLNCLETLIGEEDTMATLHQALETQTLTMRSHGRERRASGTFPRAARPEAGDVIDGWRIIRSIGSGGMAELFLVEDVSGRGELQVLKFLHAHLQTDSALCEMLVREGELSMRLRGPHVVHTYEVGQWRGAPYLRLEWVHGQTLAATTRAMGAQGLKWGAALSVALVVRVLQALAEAHELRDSSGHPMPVIHRDVSPQNIMISNQGRVQLLDFGVAKALPALSTPFSTQFKGKARYAAPEQIRCERVGISADLYAVGVVLWELLCGCRLVRGKGVAAFDEALTVVPPMPSARVAGIPAALDRLVLSCVEKDPAMRPQTARDLARALLAACPAAAAIDHDDFVTARLASQRGRLTASEALELGLAPAGPKSWALAHDLARAADRSCADRVTSPSLDSDETTSTPRLAPGRPVSSHRNSPSRPRESSCSRGPPSALLRRGPRRTTSARRSDERSRGVPQTSPNACPQSRCHGTSMLAWPSPSRSCFRSSQPSCSCVCVDPHDQAARPGGLRTPSSRPGRRWAAPRASCRWARSQACAACAARPREARRRAR